MLKKLPISAFHSLCLLLAPLAVSHVNAGSPPAPPEPSAAENAPFSIGGILFPHVHLRVVGGDSTADDIESLAAGHHDPNRNGITLQSLEPGFSLRANEYLEGFITANIFLDLDDELDAELEEAFLKLKSLPGGFELRGGQFLNRFGQHNATHLHGWSFVDTNLVNGRFLGDDGLISYGGEITWNLPEPAASAISVAIGRPKEHDHDHSHAHHHQHEEDHDSHHDHDHHHHHVHGLSGEDALFEDYVITGRWLVKLDYNDFHQTTSGLSAAYGDNVFGKETWVLGADFEYLWRAKGYEAGGDYLRWRTEAMLRNVAWRISHHEEHHAEEHDHGDHHDEDEHHHEDHHHHKEAAHGEESGDNMEFGIYSMISYGFLDRFEASLRADYVSGVDDLELEARYRISPALTAYLDSARNVSLRIQYNYDHGEDFGDEHSIWLQLGLSWGAPEVR